MAFLGYRIEFYSEIGYLYIMLSKNGKETKSCLPQDHLYEEKIRSCISFMAEKLQTT